MQQRCGAVRAAEG
ncbi:hypothetical protein AYI68_g6917, partial [Smittium mucronatum]